MEGPILVVGYFWMLAQGRDPAAELTPTMPGLAIGHGLGLAIAGLSLGSAWLARRVRALDTWREFVEGTLGTYLGSASLPALALLSLLAGLGEEVFFRGALQGAIGLVPTAVLFGLAHVAVPKKEMLPFLAYTVGVGLVFGLVRLWQPLFTLAVAHATVDLVDTYYLHFAQRRRRAGAEIGDSAPTAREPTTAA
jgi:membrane protease YdiL (CAAX protease family)